MALLYEAKESTQIFWYYDAHWVVFPMERRSTIGYSIFVGEKIIS